MAYSCPIPEHGHGEECFQYVQRLVCPLYEGEVHQHTEDCYASNPELSCPLEESEEHTHGETCYTENPVLICPLADVPHAHNENCYQEAYLPTCGLEEHIHGEDCTLPIVENEVQWAQSTLGAELNGDWNHDLLAIAQTQLGYAPDGTNYILQSDGKTPAYYTRYGDWFGDGAEIVYGNWCMMFVSFCLHYAGIDAFPYGAACDSWLHSIDSSYFHPLGGAYRPKSGDIVLFTYGRTAFEKENAKRQSLGLEPLDESARVLTPAHVGIVAGVTGDTLCTIEGNNGPVGYHYYRLGNETFAGAERNILGYVSLPPNPHRRTISDIAQRCQIEGDFPANANAYLREPTHYENTLWQESYPQNRYILAWGVSFVHGARDYYPQGALRYRFFFDALPEDVSVTCLIDNTITEIPCTREGNALSFETELVGTFFFGTGE